MAEPFLPDDRPEPHRAELFVRTTRGAGAGARVTITSGGLLSIAVLVSSILVSTAVLVGAAQRN